MKKKVAFYLNNPTLPECDYSSIIKAGGVLMQRTVRDLFALWSSALAVVSV